MTTESKELQTTETLSMSARFTEKVMAEFNGNVAGGLQVTDYQRQLIQGYFVGIDRALKTADEERIRKNENNRDDKYNNNLPIIWQNVNLNDLALDVLHYARMGLDMMQPNHVSPIPFKNNKAQKYDVTLMPGYNGIQYIAENYALIKPKSVTIDLVYSTDTFKPIKKSRINAVETYDFEINNPFDRGEVVGGFGYIEYDDPSRNELVIMTMKDILKRKPKYASANFWGGKTKVWEKGKQVETETDGWMEEMFLKTLKREVYSAKHIPRDPKKIDDNYQYMRAQEAKLAAAADDIREEINITGNQTIIDTTPHAAIPERAIEEKPPVYREERPQPAQHSAPADNLFAAQPMPAASTGTDEGPTF